MRLNLESRPEGRRYKSASHTGSHSDSEAPFSLGLGVAARAATHKTNSNAIFRPSYDLACQRLALVRALLGGRSNIFGARLQLRPEPSPIKSALTPDSLISSYHANSRAP